MDNTSFAEFSGTQLSSTSQGRKPGRLLPRKYGQPGIRSGDLGSHARPLRVSTLGKESSERRNKSYSDLKHELLESGSLWEDPDFPAEDKSIYFTQKPQKKIKWLRPKEICNDPKIFVEGASRFDIIQGKMGDCWFLAAVATLALNPRLLGRVIPSDQSFAEEDYCGAFHFHFWRFGTWVDIIVDDRLPTHAGKLVFLHSGSENEFWTALLEKAFAKMHGCYEALDGGWQSEAMTDFTGGVTQYYDLRNEVPADLFLLMKKSLERHGMLGVSNDPTPGIIEAKMTSGLIAGHAYSITACALPYVETKKCSGNIPMVRIRNPWGEVEWKGSFSDRSSHWRLLSEEEKRKVGLTCETDGEFWMSYYDFLDNFQVLEVTNLGPDVWYDTPCHAKWEMNLIESSWEVGYNAGGCYDNSDTFHTNPQFRVVLNDPDEDDEDEKCTCIIAVMQKGMRAKRREGRELLHIGFDVYELTGKYKRRQKPASKWFLENNLPVATFEHDAQREVTKRLRLYPGTYVVIPSTVDPDQPADFIIRIFTEKAHVTEHMDEESGVDPTAKPPPPTPEDAVQAEKLGNVFGRIAGDRMEVDYLGVKEILNRVLTKEIRNFDGFSSDCCRNMIAMVDVHGRGKLGLKEFWKLWDNLRWWKAVFKDYDKDRSGTVSTYGLIKVLRRAGFRLSSDVCKAIVMRYGNSMNNVNFADFIACAVKLRTLLVRYRIFNPAGMSFEEWLEASL